MIRKTPSNPKIAHLMIEDSTHTNLQLWDRLIELNLTVKGAIVGEKAEHDLDHRQA